MSFVCLMFVMSLCASVYMCFVVTCWERADLLALVCGVYCEFVTFPLVSWVRCGTWLYRFLIFAHLLTLIVICVWGKVRWLRTSGKFWQRPCLFHIIIIGINFFPILIEHSVWVPLQTLIRRHVMPHIRCHILLHLICVCTVRRRLYKLDHF